MSYTTPDEIVHTVKCNVEESIKLDKATEIGEMIVDAGDRGVMFSMFKPGLRELQQRFADRGIRAAVYDGSTSQWERNRIELDFDVKTAPKEYRYDLVLANYKTGSEGLNFNTANHLVRIDRQWNPGKEDQALGRIKRFGQTKVMQEHIIQVKPSVDTWMAALIDMKREIVNGFEDHANALQNMYQALRDGDI